MYSAKPRLRDLPAKSNFLAVEQDSGPVLTVVLDEGVDFPFMQTSLNDHRGYCAHLPCSTLMMLISAFASRELVLEAYAKAVEEKYRFYSYGDCMLIV